MRPYHLHYVAVPVQGRIPVAYRRPYSKTSSTHVLAIRGITKRLQQCREMAGLSQEEVARRLGISAGRYQKWETRSPIRIEFLADTCLILRVPPWYLLTGVREMPAAFKAWYAAHGQPTEPQGADGHT